jgi:O-antigen/teichoic acid export membrane protein
LTAFPVLFRQVLAVGISGLGGQLLTLVTLPVLSRLYPPESFGGWGLWVSAGLVIGPVATLRYELAVVLPRRDRPAAALVVAALVAALTVSVLTVLVMMPLAVPLFGQHALEQLGGAIWTLSLLVFLSASFQCGLAWSTRRMAFAVYSFAQFLLPAATAFAQIGAALLNIRGSGGLIAGTLIGYLVAVGFMWVRMLARDGAILGSGMSFRRVFAVARRFSQYPLYMTPYTVLGTLRDRTVYFLIGKFGTAEAVGHYTMAQRVANVPSSFASGAIRPVFFQHAARRELSELGPTVFAVIAGLLATTVPNLIVFWFHAEAIVTMVLGAPWRAATPYTLVLSIPALVMLLGNWLDRALDVSGRQRLAFILELIFSAMIVTTMLATFMVTADIWFAVVAQAAATALYFLIWLWFVFRAARFSASALPRLLVFAVVLGVGCAVLLWGLQLIFSLYFAVGLFYLLYSCAIAGAMIYVYRCKLKLLT